MRGLAVPVQPLGTAADLLATSLRFCFYCVLGKDTYLIEGGLTRADMVSTPVPPQAKAPISEAISPDKSTDAPPVKDAPPSIESMLAVAWERTLSYLSPAGITTVSYRVSKTLGAGEDKAESPEKAAKLALEDMMKRAWTEANATYDDVSADDDYIDPSCTVEEMLAVPAFSGESFLRTYHLALIMIGVGDRKTEALKGNGSVCFHLPMAMWLLYGRPPLSPLCEFGGTLVHDMGVKVVLMFAPAYNWDLDKPVDTEDQRRKTKETLDKFNRIRLLHFAERLGKVGQYMDASMLLTMLAYDRPHMMGNTHVYQAEYFVGSRVMLKGLSRKELNGRVAVVQKEYNEKNARIGVAFADDEAGSQRMIGIKPENLELHENDTELLIDVKIAHAHILSSRLQANDGYRPPLIALLVHTLRGIVAKLHKSEDIEDGSESTPLFPSKSHRLLHAQTTLARLLTHIAKKIAMKMIPCDFAGLTCVDFEQIKAIIHMYHNIFICSHSEGTAPYREREYQTWTSFVCTTCPCSILYIYVLYFISTSCETDSSLQDRSRSRGAEGSNFQQPTDPPNVHHRIPRWVPWSWGPCRQCFCSWRKMHGHR